ncbi:hypothetical protein JTB14_034119 [Gonioctena quinquepunctata]|nr:hypothetical protein JTB14_034119 [Gonioctena quinquepunctata]
MRPSRSQAKKKKKLNAADEEFISNIKTNLASGNQPQTSNQMESDDDKLFCLSLHKELLEVPEENRLQTKIELMKVLRTQQALCFKPVAARSAYQAPTQYHYQTEMAQRGQREYFGETGYTAIDPSTSSFPPATFSTYNRSYCTASTPPTTSSYKNQTTPSPASTQDSNESELMELYDN